MLGALVRQFIEPWYILGPRWCNFINTFLVDFGSDIYAIDEIMDILESEKSILFEGTASLNNMPDEPLSFSAKTLRNWVHAVLQIPGSFQ